MAGNAGDLLTITDPDGSEEERAARKGVIFTARIHPGESNSSYVMKGMLEYLTAPDAPLEVRKLLRHFVFKFVPMINIDGVVCGNYRANLSGMDPNRKWNVPNASLFPEVYAIKRMAYRFSREHELVLYCDIHGHSRSR